MFRRIKYAFQRAFRGYDDTVFDDFQQHLIKYMIKITKAYASEDIILEESNRKELLTLVQMLEQSNANMLQSNLYGKATLSDATLKVIKAQATNQRILAFLKASELSEKMYENF